MKALSAVEETEDDRRARRLVFARIQVAELTATIAGLTKQLASFRKKEIDYEMPADHPALLACEARRDEELALRAGGEA